MGRRWGEKKVLKVVELEEIPLTNTVNKMPVATVGIPLQLFIIL